MNFIKSMNSSEEDWKTFPGSSLNSTSLEFDINTTASLEQSLNKSKHRDDPDRLKVSHAGLHGEQFGMLITRHYIRPDSKCIQCCSCGIFFTPTLFLMHSHDKYGKRLPCNAVQLQLAIENPSINEKQKWNEFQQKLHSKNLNTKKIQSETKSFYNVSFIENEKSNIKQTISDMDNKYTEDKTAVKDNNTEKENFPILKKYPSMSSVHLANSFSSKYDKILSVSDLKTDKPVNYSPNTDIKSSDQYVPESKKFKENDVRRFAPIHKPPLLASRMGIIKPNAFGINKIQNKLFPKPLSELNFGEAVVTSNIRDSVQSDKKKSDTSKQLDMHQVKATGNGVKENNQVNPTSLILDASKLLEQAVACLYQRKDAGSQGPVSSSAWRKMYEEERDHRMRLEARVRTLERELVLRK